METIIKPIKFTKRALKDLEKITKFNIAIFGSKKAKKRAHQIVDTSKILESSEYDFKNIGKKDDFFSHLKRDYRKIFYKKYKITYREGKTNVYIVRVFDTNQNPNKNR